jgi:ribulose-5-phosphate 4-epimerase/fuculose-1-phosphate aldolase
MDKKGTLPNERIHITPKCIVHLHGHYNKVVHLMKPSILAILMMALRFEATISCVRFITTTSSIKTQSSKVM